MSNTENNPLPPKKQKLTPEIFVNFLQLQKKELEVKGQELEIRDKEFALAVQQDNNQKDIAEKAIAANLENLKGERGYLSGRMRIISTLAVTIFLIMAAFCAYALSIGQAPLVMELIKIVGLVACGFVGGYGLRASKIPKPDQNED